MTSPHDVDWSDKAFWSEQHQKFAEPHFRLLKSARLINRLAASRPCSLLDVGCARGALRELLQPNVDYFGIDLAIADPGPHFREMDLSDNPVDFDGRHFDFVVAQGVFEYLARVQGEKFREIAQILSPGGRFIVTYENFDHRQPSYFWAYRNVQSPAAFRSSLENEFVVERQLPTSLNWTHSQPVRPFLKAMNMPLVRPIPLVTRRLAVEYLYVCSKRASPLIAQGDA